jgi:hypothetical protein
LTTLGFIRKFRPKRFYKIDSSSYFSDGETPPSNGSSTPAVANSGNAKVPKRYKAHLRDFLSSCRGKRAKHTHHSPTGMTIKRCK